MTMKVGRSLGKPSRHELSQFSSVCCLKEHNAMFWTFEVVRNIYRYIAVIGASGEANLYSYTVVEHLQSILYPFQNLNCSGPTHQEMRILLNL